MRSLVMAVFLFMSAISSALSEAFNPLLMDPLLIWNYGSMAVLAGICGVVFWFSVRHIDTREDEFNQFATGHAGTDKDRVITKNYSEKEVA
jgi:proton-dependent oligopeptide transporter, POT family